MCDMSNLFSTMTTNLAQRILGREVRFSRNLVHDVFVAREHGRSHYFSGYKRGKGLYRKGIQARGDALARTYGIHTILFEPTDTVIDCGANYGDLWIYLDGKIVPENYITFEPGADEHRAVKLNAPKGTHFEAGLGDSDTTQHFYINSEKGDSSFVEPRKFHQVAEKPICTLASKWDELRISKLKLLKIEAEGYEPEILLGAQQFLDRIDYVAIDGGYERGIDQEETFCFQVNLLTSHGFTMEYVFLPWGRALFKSPRCSSP